MEILDLNNSTFLINFNSEKDYLNALTGGPWVILDHYLIVHQWSHTFRTSNKPHRSVVAWVQLPELPIHFYHREVLFALGNILGRTVKLDYHTEHMERGKFARIAVELDMTKPLETRIRLDGFWQQVVYENLPEICFECGQIRHSEAICPKLHNPPANKSQAGGSDLLQLPEGQSPEPPAGFGPWMQVTRKSRSQNRKGQANHGSAQSNQTGRINDGGKTSTKSGKNPKHEQGNSNISKDRKGKEELKAEPKKGKANLQMGKTNVSDANLAKEGQASGPPQKWRTVGLKPKEASLASSSQPIGETASKADLTMTNPSEKEPIILNPAHKPSSSRQWHFFFGRR
ncbi:unnamed protein product [Linum tenue]|uniref:DUF4283 domain-containing protein n=1 Tax=Linum tenue TaxID=586396 RepID=A0AAV0KJR2_9ROSI|nr:unnamed protein product [Linum tenue]